jgi:hypothetical protein
VCNKIITYERDPFVSNPAWLRHAVMLVGSSACHLSMKQVSRNIGAELVQRRGYDDIDTLWCSSSSPVIGLFNSGISFYNYRGWIGMEAWTRTGCRAWPRVRARRLPPSSPVPRVTSTVVTT